MGSTFLWILLAVLGLLALVVVPGCTVGQGFRGPGYDRDRGVTLDGAGPTVLVAVTHTTVARERGPRREFSRQLWRVVDTMPEVDGLVGYSVRRQLFGDDAWTLSVWADEASLDRFLRSPAHREAVRSSGETLTWMRSVRFEVAAADLPLPWPRVLRELDRRSAPAPTAAAGAAP